VTVNLEIMTHSTLWNW